MGAVSLNISRARRKEAAAYRGNTQPEPNLEATVRELNDIRRALDQSAIVAITDRTGRIIHVNDKFCEISQYRREELIGQNHRIINSGHHAPEFFVEMWKTIARGEVWEGEIRNRAKDGSLYWVNTTIVPFLDQDGKPYQYVSIRYETTQRKHAEEQLRIYAEKLERTNHELAKSVDTVLDREAQILMQDRLASVGLLASSLAHEIGTPLGVIRGRAEYVTLQAKGDAEIKKNMTVIVAQIDRVSTLIRSLLNLARGDQRQHTGRVHLGATVDEVLELLAHELRKNEIVVRNDLGAEVTVYVKAEPGPLHQVLLNLLVNAIHAIGSARKNGRAAGHSISLQAVEEGAHWVLTIADTGCGISAANKKKLFTPFFTTKEIGMGTGLGLSTSYRIVESWGGRIEVTSEEGRGSEFRVFLPKA